MKGLVFLIFLGCLVMNWSCGMAVNMEELFGSEGKAQVYGHLHDLLSKENMSSTGNTFRKAFTIRLQGCYLCTYMYTVLLYCVTSKIWIDLEYVKISA